MQESPGAAVCPKEEGLMTDSNYHAAVEGLEACTGDYPHMQVHQHLVEDPVDVPNMGVACFDPCVDLVALSSAEITNHLIPTVKKEFNNSWLISKHFRLRFLDGKGLT